MNFFDTTQPLTLSMLNGIVRQTIEHNLQESFWVQAELASVRENHGHCYMELIEKGTDGDTTLKAQARACCWRNTWLHVSRRFTEATGTPMRAGMKVLLCVHANFHETFGFSWIVDDIDPTFTLGDMAQRRKEIIRILTEQGVIDLNKQLTVSPFCKRIAVISSATAAGYGDFSNQLNDNTYGFKFETQLFPAIMQGENVENSIIQALSKIYTCNNFDCVVIIRGGGSTSDLSGFDTLPLAENVANFPLPVITGIGHDRDKSILDIVACVSLKTPTAVAEFLISNLATTLERITTCEQQLKSVFDIRKLREETYLNNLFLKLYNITEKKLLIDNNKIKIFEQRLIALDPVNILKKGYSITLKDGIAVKDASTLSEGDKLTLMFAHGTTEAVVKH